MPAKKSKPKTVPNPPTPTTSEPVLPVELAVPGKLAMAQAIENTINLKKPALYRLQRAHRVPVYKTGRKGGLRFLLEEVISAIRRVPVTEPEIVEILTRVKKTK